MSITLSAGSDSSNDIQISKLTDLQNNTSTLLKLADSIIGDLNKQVSTILTASNPATLIYQSGNNSWTVGDFTFGLSGGVTGSVSVWQPGQELLTYTKTFPTTISEGLNTDTSSAVSESIKVPDGQYYVGIELDLTLAANAAATVQLGSVGIQASAGNSDTFKVRFYKNVGAGTILLKDALVVAFEGFVLPLHSETYQNLKPNDYLYHQFNATLNLGFGATLGLDKVFFSGQYTSQLASPAAPSINTSVKAEVKAGATFGATFKYTGSYEALLWRVDDKSGRFHLYRNKTTDANFNFGATVTVIANPNVTLSDGNLVTLANQVLPGSTAAVSQLLAGPAQTQVNAWVNDVQTKINSLLQPFQQGQTQLQMAIDNTESSFLLMNVTFDLTAIGFTPAWDKVIAGDFNAALALPTGGVSLDVGSGLENFYKRTTSITFNLFGLFQSEWSTEHIQNYSILYVGNNTFHLIERIGVIQTSTVNGRGKEVDLYFAAEATSTNGKISLGDIDLYIQLTATANGGFGQSIAGFFSNAATGDTARQLTKQLLASAQQPKTTQTLQLIFKPTAYGNTRLTSSTLNGKNPIINEGADKKNYATFANACSKFESSPPANFSVLKPLDMDYAIWSEWNINANDSQPTAASVPSRRDPSGMDSNGWAYLDQRFDNSPIASGLIAYALQAASDFMNLCEDLKNLAVLIESTGASWKLLRTDLGNIVQNDVPVNFLIPAALALTSLMGLAGVQPLISGPAPVATPQSAITVTLTYS